MTSAKLFALCLRISPDRQEAEDALQDAYLAVWRRAESFDDTRGSAAGWLIVLTRNVAIDRLRRRRPSDPAAAADEIPDPAPSAFDRLADGEERRRLAECIDRLDPVDAGFIRTAFFRGVTYADLADRTAQPAGTVKSRIRRALLRLRTCLQ